MLWGIWPNEAAVYSLLPEFFLIMLVLTLIMVAVTTPKENQKFLLDNFLDFSLYGFGFLMIYFFFLGQTNLFSSSVTIFYAYNTLKINTMLIAIKFILAFFAFGSLMSVKRYLMLYQLITYEYPLLICLTTLSMFVSISANNWIILFLSLELQALCFLVLFAWNRRSAKAINATLKFGVINFVASTFILLAFIEIILYTQTFNMYLANPVFFCKNWVNYMVTQSTSLFDPAFLFWGVKKGFGLLNNHYGSDFIPFFYSLAGGRYVFHYPLLNWLTQNLDILVHTVVADNGFFYNSLWQFVGFLLILGFGMKLGLVPFGFWLQDLYMSVSLPVLTFFSTAPKLTYITILLSLYINLFSFINPEAFLQPLMFLGGITIFFANLIMFTIRNNLLVLLAWSSIANMGLLFLLFGKYPLGSFTLTFIIYYTVSTFLFFLLLQYFIIMDETGVVRHPIYFTDLSVVRYHTSYKAIFLVLVLSFLNFFGIPPLLGFWMKFSVLQGLVLNTHSLMEWLLIVILVLMTIIGGFSYIRVLYTLLTENTSLGLHLLYWPNTHKDLYIVYWGFLVFQFLAFVGYSSISEFFTIQGLFTNLIVIV